MRSILDSLTVEDAIKTYQAIRLAQPGCLGEVKEQDISAEPTVTLRDAMAITADRDLIAAQYVNGFADVFAGCNWLKLQQEQYVGHPEVSPQNEYPLHRLNRLTVNLYFWFLSHHLDSLVVRKRGSAEAEDLQRRVIALLESQPATRHNHLSELNAWFAAEFPHRNPGTTADLVCASLFVALRTGIIPLPEIPDEYLKEL